MSSLHFYLNYSKIIKFYIKKPTPIQLSVYKEHKIVKNDDWNKIKNGDITLEYYLHNNKMIGCINYRVYTGQIGLFFLEPNYRNIGLGKQILNKAINDIKQNNINEVWAVTSKNHVFWSNVYNGKFKYKEQLHPSVTGSGYSITL
jgi:GNAT superfamily N-acetyltransferase